MKQDETPKKQTLKFHAGRRGTAETQQGAQSGEDWTA